MDEGKGPNPYFEGNHDGESDEMRALRLTLAHGNDALRAELKRVKDYVRTANDIITNQCIAMQAALLEQSIGKGDEAALEWISNTLCGPGLLPDDSEAAHLPDTPTKGPAQAWFDAKMAEHEAMRAKQDAAVGAA